MGNIFKLLDHSSRLTAEYSEARMLFEERRQAQARVVDIDRALRELSKEDPEAVQAAHSEIPLRGRHGRTSPRSQL